MAQEVTFTASIANGAVAWEVNGAPAKEHRTRIPPGSKPQKIRFIIDDNSGRSLRFDCGFPFQISEQAGCPPPEEIASNQVEVLSCQPKRLVIRDRNTGDRRDLHYQLNVVDKHGNRAPCDPIIENGGGGTGVGGE